MNTETVIDELLKRHPHKKITKRPDKNPTEVICETMPTKKHPEQSEAIVVVDSSQPHYHAHSSELFAVLAGEVLLRVAGRELKLEEGKSIIIPAGVIHSAVAEAAYVQETHQPGLLPHDRIVMNGSPA